ncbi:MAG: serine/threonine-protein kinase [Isosphaeraceae bacterium]
MSPPDPTDGTVPPEPPGDPSTEESWATHASASPAGLEEDLITKVGATGLGTDSGTDSVPEYELLTLLGEGAMGRVWKARQTRLNRLVALKMVLGDKPAGSKDLIRFLAEAESVAAVRHPNVVQVYEYGEFRGRPFLAMEYLPGGNLADRLKTDGRLDPKSAAKLVGTLASAVHAAHDLGIVHRDLKPANVLFDEHGEPRVADFGIAKRATSTDLTATQAVMGTPAYMAPEQARGETKFVGPQADIYSLGVILFECLTGTRPFVAADPLALLRKVEEEEPERPSRRVLGLPRDIELICLKCLAKDPTERYETAEALASDLAHFVAGETVSVRSAGTVERVAKWARRKPTLAAVYALGLLALLLGGLGGVAVWQWREAATTRDDERLARRRAEEAQKQEKQAREQLASVEYGRTIEVAYQEWRDGNFFAAVALLDGTREELRGWEWKHVHRLCHPDLFTLMGHADLVTSASFSPDGARVVTASWDGTAKVWDAKSGAGVLTLKGHAWFVNSASFSPDGARVVSASQDGTAKVWDAKSGAELLTLKGHAGSVNSASFSPDGASSPRARTGRRGFGTRRARGAVHAEGHTSIVNSAWFSPDGARVVTASWDGTARVWDAKSGAEVLTLKGHTDLVNSAWFSPTGARRHREPGQDGEGLGREERARSCSR